MLGIHKAATQFWVMTHSFKTPDHTGHEFYAYL